MKERYFNTLCGGFSTIELLIALTLLTISMTGALHTVWGSQYWLITATTAHEALQKNKSIVNSLVQESQHNFQSVSSSPPRISQNFFDPSDESCIQGGLCYRTETSVVDISSCAKSVAVAVRWQLGARYPTSSVSVNTFVNNPNEISAVGGDCLIATPDGNWGNANVVTGSSITQEPLGTTGIDVLEQHVYVTSVLSPFLRIFQISDNPAIPPVRMGSSTAAGLRLNDIDVMRDFSTGRIYAYVTQHSTTSQLAVFDVTDPSLPVLLLQLPLFNVASTGSFPQGWRVFAYGEKLYVVSRETTGPELHIFSLRDPRLPVEINSAVINLNRTVNDMVVRDEMVGNTVKRFLYLAASSDLKEVGVYDVTGTIPIEVAAINLAGTADASSLYLTGTTLYVGRKSSSAPELYAFDALKLLQGELLVRGSSELGTEVVALSGIGTVLLVGTAKNGEEVQLWNPDVLSWSTTTLHAGRLVTHSSPQLPPLGFDMYGNYMYVISQSQSVSEAISILYSP